MNDSISITGSVLEYSDDLFEEALEEDGWRGNVKAFLSGIIKGFVDFMFIFGTAIWCIIVFLGFFEKKSK